MRNLAPVVVASVVVAVVACTDDLPVEANPADAPLLNASTPASMIQSASVHWLSDLSDVEGATAQLKRTKSGAAYSFRTTGLEKGHVVTMWWVIFNNPEECENPVPDLKSECNLPDLSNPDVEPSVMGSGATSSAGAEVQRSRVT